MADGDVKDYAGDKKKPSMALVISVGPKMPKSPEETSKPDEAMKKAWEVMVEDNGTYEISKNENDMLDQYGPPYQTGAMVPNYGRRDMNATGKQLMDLYQQRYGEAPPQAGAMNQNREGTMLGDYGQGKMPRTAPVPLAPLPSPDEIEAERRRRMMEYQRLLSQHPDRRRLMPDRDTDPFAKSFDELKKNVLPIRNRAIPEVVTFPSERKLAVTPGRARSLRRKDMDDFPERWRDIGPDGPYTEGEIDIMDHDPGRGMSDISDPDPEEGEFLTFEQIMALLPPEGYELTDGEKMLRESAQQMNPGYFAKAYEVLKIRSAAPPRKPNPVRIRRKPEPEPEPMPEPQEPEPEEDPRMKMRAMQAVIDKINSVRREKDKFNEEEEVAPTSMEEMSDSLEDVDLSHFLKPPEER